MIGLCLILIIIGFVIIFFGYQQNNDINSQLESLFSSGSLDPGTVWIIIGAALLIISIVVLVITQWDKNKGQPLQGPYQPNPAPQMPGEQNVAYCSHCGAKLKPNANFCPYCGSQVREAVNQPAETSQESAKEPLVAEKEIRTPEEIRQENLKSWLVALLCVCGLVGCGALLYIFSYMQ
ncbi:MAG TPA: zinc ribbon domain-containing protein [Candidatus Faecimorpha stercoravium]|nr:zinc ribbon domain-containing protein [Candidatus Faecimorpha stercoravium]